MSFFVEVPACALFSIFYWLVCAGFVLQFKEFRGAGLSTENLLSGLIGCSEEVTLLEFHLKRTAFTLLLHSALPLGFLIGYSYLSSNVDANYPSMLSFWQNNPAAMGLLNLSIVVPISVAALVYFWSVDNWSRHPFVKRLQPYATNGLWRHVAGDINAEFRRIDKFTIQTNAITKVIVTDNWILLLGQWPWTFHVAHQSDVNISLLRSDHHEISTEGQVGGTQYLTIQVNNNRRHNNDNFVFRLNALEYQNLRDKLQGPIDNKENIQIFKTIGERFVEVFRREVESNPPAPSEEGLELEKCIGCMVLTANVKLVRRCANADTANPCVNCYCRPMWCLDCLAKWFGTRQNQKEPETWLSSKCPCPTCRSKFCVLDVAVIRGANPTEEEGRAR